MEYKWEGVIKGIEVRDEGCGRPRDVIMYSSRWQDSGGDGRGVRCVERLPGWSGCGKE